MACIKHDFRLVNNRYYFTGKPVPEGKPWGDGKSEWVTEQECEVCGDVLKVPEFYKSLIKKGKKIIVVFASGHKGKEYDSIKGGLFLCSVEQLKEFLILENNIPVDFSTGRDTTNIADK